MVKIRLKYGEFNGHKRQNIEKSKIYIKRGVKHRAAHHSTTSTSAKGGGRQSQNEVLVTPPHPPRTYFVQFSNRGYLVYLSVFIKRGMFAQ
jgi:hypothetical protein